MSRCHRSALIVEGQPFVAMVASDILNEVGFKTLHAANAVEAIALLRSHPEVGLLVIDADLYVPADGVGLGSTVTSERPDVKIVVTWTGPEATPAAMPKRVRALRKPFASSELRALVVDVAPLQDA